LRWHAGIGRPYITDPRGAKLPAGQWIVGIVLVVALLAVVLVAAGVDLHVI